MLPARREGRTTSSDETSGRSDDPVTTRAVSATYEPKDCHSKGCRRPQAADLMGRGKRKGKNSSARSCLQSAADRTADYPARKEWRVGSIGIGQGVAGVGSEAGSRSRIGNLCLSRCHNFPLSIVCN